MHVTIDTYLRKAEALVLMASEYPGLWPKDQDGGFISYQIQKAKEFRKACYLWLRVDDLATIRKAPYRNYLQTLSKQAEQAHLVLRFPNVDAFVTHIHDSLHTSPALDPGVEQLAVVCSNLPENEEVGQNFREMVREALRDINREIFIFDFANNRERVKLKHLEDRIRDADTVLVLCFDQQWDWARPLIHEINGFRNLRTGHKAKLLIAGPQDRHAGLYDAGTFGFKTLDGVHIGAERLKQMLKQEILKPALVEGRVP